jgi:hypothetical protein
VWRRRRSSSVRSTNVYEERSLGIFEDKIEDIENEADYPATDSRVAIWGRYLGRHARRQLSFGKKANLFPPSFLTGVRTRQNDGVSFFFFFNFTDMWWIALALFVICIAEVCVRLSGGLLQACKRSLSRENVGTLIDLGRTARSIEESRQCVLVHNLCRLYVMSPSSSRALHIYIYIYYPLSVFEIVSAYGTVGLSLGVPSVESQHPIFFMSNFVSFVLLTPPPFFLMCLCHHTQENYSLSGAMSTFSKLIICVVMLRGRHRGLPVALDRAIVFPTEFADKASEKVKEMKMKRRVEATPTAFAPEEKE